MRTRKISALAMTAVALGLALTACNNNGADNASSSASSSPVTTSNPQSDTAKDKPSGTPAKSDTKCTDQLNYAGDPRSNAEINSIGASTGT
ncbi:hypothetical protein ACFVJK_41595, partial [Streptomyces sp. NPDC127172]